jgi:hypothetical protein
LAVRRTKKTEELTNLARFYIQAPVISQVFFINLKFEQMPACNFSLPFSGPAEMILEKAKSTVVSQGGTFEGDASVGSFELSIFGNAIIGSYKVAGSDLNIVIEEKPFLVPCSAIESFLKKQIS